MDWTRDSKRTFKTFSCEMRQEVRPIVSISVPEEQHADQDKCRGNCIPDKVHPMDALTKPVVFVRDIKTISALHITNQRRHKFSDLLLEITRLFTLKGAP